jgi:hypothetical protein
MGWWDRVIKEAETRLSEETKLLEDAYSKDFAEYAKETNLFFSYGDLHHLIHTGITYGMNLKRFGASLQLAHYETLIKRFKLYLLQELKFVVANKPPFHYDRGIDYSFAAEILDLLKTLDRLANEMAELRKGE